MNSTAVPDDRSPQRQIALLEGVNHLASLTSDLDRLTTFYREVFEVPVIVELEEDGVRHAMLPVGTNTVLHPFEILDGAALSGPHPMFQRGRLDHFALNAQSEEAFHELRRRTVAAGASDGEIADFGPAVSFTFIDPDGNENEVVWLKPDQTWANVLRRSEWPRIPMDG